MKIQIIGYSGSGKSTLAKKLGEHYKIPVLYLDNTLWYGNWERRSDEDQAKIVKDFMDENESWVIDGNYKRVEKRRFEECDQVIFLNYNRFFCYFQARKRYKEWKGKIRYSCPCEEKFDLKFQKFILWDQRKRKSKKKMIELFNKCKGEKLMFKSRKQLDKYLKSINVE